jgi:prepilin-type N-terminal cleavage/methylation domain-containing protein
MKDNLLKKQLIANIKGVTLTELLVVLVICAVVIGGLYKVFIAQTRAYTVQDQVAEVQQDVRGAMEIMVRDIRMAGFQTNSFSNATITNSPIVPDPADNSHITVNYEYISPGGAGTAYQVDYKVVGGNLNRTLNGVADPTPLLTNVGSLNFGYGIDTTGDGIVTGINSNGVSVIPDGAFVSAAGVGTSPILTVQITLIANPAPVDPDVQKMVSPRKLTSVVTPRNVFIRNITFNRYKVY